MQLEIDYYCLGAMNEFVLLFVLFARFEMNQQASWAGPYEVHITDAEECEDTGTHEVILSIKMVKHYKNKVIFGGKAILPYGWSDKLTVQVHIAQWSNGKWNEKFFSKNLGGACSSMKLLAPAIAEKTFAALGTKDCPKPGNYTLNEISIDIEINGVPVFVYGKYKAKVFLIKVPPDRVKVGCYTVTTEIVPKPKGSKRRNKPR